MSKVLLLTLAVWCGLMSRSMLAQDVFGSYFRCRSDYNIEYSVLEKLRSGDFSVRNPIVECFGECFVKKAGFMNDDFSFNKGTVVKFASRFIKQADSEQLYDQCTSGVSPRICATAFEVYQCIYEGAVAKWNTKR